MSIWNNEDPKINLATVRKIVKEAKLQKLWIVIGKKWFTPEEFEKYCNKIVIPESGKIPHKMEDIKLGDPVETIQKLRLELDKKEQALTAWSIRVVEYYRNL